MIRYKVTADYDVAGFGTTAEEDPNGEWVKWEDLVYMVKHADECPMPLEKDCGKCQFSEVC